LSQDSYVKLAEFESSITAPSMRILLEANGIEARVHGDFIAEIASVEHIRLVVRESDLEMAKRVINEVPAAAETLVPEWVCDCGATVDEGFQICWSCGHECDTGI